MSVNFSILQDRQAIVIEVGGHASTIDVVNMRRRTVELQQQTSISCYLVDLRELESIDDGSVFEAHDLGERFAQVGFSNDNLTAVLLPEDTQARRQIEFLHNVEINRGRGPIKYVESYSDAFDWFAACA
jgi:hypothetical protein